MAFFGLFGFSSVSCVLGGVLVLLVSLLRTGLGLLWCASCWTRLFFLFLLLPSLRFFLIAVGWLGACFFLD